MGISTIVGGDLSLRHTGICKTTADLEIKASCVITNKVGKHELRGAARLEHMQHRFSKFIGNASKSTLVVLEGYAYNGRSNSVAQIGELGGVIRLLLYQNNFNYVVMAPKAMKKHVAGNGNATKEDIKRAINDNYGYTFESEDEYDAFGLVLCGAEILSALKKRRSSDLKFDYCPSVNSIEGLDNLV